MYITILLYQGFVMVRGTRGPFPDPLPPTFDAQEPPGSEGQTGSHGIVEQRAPLPM